MKSHDGVTVVHGGSSRYVERPAVPTEWGARAMTRNGLRPPGAPINVCAPIPVRARIVWNTGEEVVDCVATAWRGQAVRVEMPERAIMIWLDAADVRRR